MTVYVLNDILSNTILKRGLPSAERLVN